MAEDQKERYIQYLAEQNQDLRLTSDAMKLVLEDFMAQMRRRMIMMEPMIRFARIRLIMSNHRGLKSLPGKNVICPIVLTVIKRWE